MRYGVSIVGRPGFLIQLEDAAFDLVMLRCLRVEAY